jgi:hypothetical protein
MTKQFRRCASLHKAEEGWGEGEREREREREIEIERVVCKEVLIMRLTDSTRSLLLRVIKLYVNIDNLSTL